MYRENSIEQSIVKKDLIKSILEEEIQIKNKNKEKERIKKEKDIKNIILSLERIDLDKVIKKVYLTKQQYIFTLKPHWYSFSLEISYDYNEFVRTYLYSKIDEAYGDFGLTFSVSRNTDKKWHIWLNKREKQ